MYVVHRFILHIITIIRDLTRCHVNRYEKRKLKKIPNFKYMYIICSYLKYYIILYHHFFGYINWVCYLFK